MYFSFHSQFSLEHFPDCRRVCLRRIESIKVSICVFDRRLALIENMSSADSLHWFKNRNNDFWWLAIILESVYLSGSIWSSFRIESDLRTAVIISSKIGCRNVRFLLLKNFFFLISHSGIILTKYPIKNVTNFDIIWSSFRWILMTFTIFSSLPSHTASYCRQAVCLCLPVDTQTTRLPLLFLNLK